MDYKDENMRLMLGDCLERMKEIPEGSVDLILTDPPYGTVTGIGTSDFINHGMKGKTAWDVAIDSEKMFAECNRALRTNGALVLFSQEPYTSHLITNAHGNIPFSYRMVWLKDHFANSLIAKKAPVNYTEDVCVFFKKYDIENLHPLRLYFADVMQFIGLNLKQINGVLGHRRAEHCFYLESTQFGLCTEATYGELVSKFNIDAMQGFKAYDELQVLDKAYQRVFNLHDGKKYKSNILEYKKDYNGYHPTQKPVALLEDLINTYSNKGNTVLDFTMGSGSTGVACVNTNRRFVGIELDQGYFAIAKQRIEDAQTQDSPHQHNLQPPGGRINIGLASSLRS